MRDPDFLKISPELKLKAKQTFESLSNQLMETSTHALEYNYNVGFSEQQEDLVVIQDDSLSLSVAYSVSAFDALDLEEYPLWVFIEAFIFLNEKRLIELVSKPHEIGLME